jgi:CRISPR-associated protein Cas5t
MTRVGSYVAAPITSFRAPRAREYLETLPAPPPATVYGMLLSAVGEPDRLMHRGAEVAVALISSGTRTRVLRTAWRVKSLTAPLGSDTNKRPDFQELLVDVRLAVHVRDGSDGHDPPLAARVEAAIRDPAAVARFGGLALGESTFLVDELRELRASDGEGGAVWLVHDPSGQLALPVWADHVGSRGTRYVQLGTREAADIVTPPEEAWVWIAPM